MHEAVPAIAALGVSPIVRIPDLQPWMVKRESPFSSVASWAKTSAVTDDFSQEHWTVVLME